MPSEDGERVACGREGNAACGREGRVLLEPKVPKAWGFRFPHIPKTASPGRGNRWSRV